LGLITKAFLGLSFLMLVLAAGLFASAGSLGYWQAWGYLGVFGSCTAVITVWLIRNDRELLARRVKAGPVAEIRRSQQVIQSFASIFFIGLFVFSGLDFRFGYTHVPSVVVVLCDLLVAAGFVIVFWVFRANRFTSGIIEVVPEQRVTQHGPYAFVRHPMYAGGGLLVLATPPALGSWASLPMSLGVLLVLVARILDEERFLSANLAGYKNYLVKVRHRLVPFVW
jgi:protein-S-isoprenylcysteine O-methyltransferase Ste14